MVFEGRNYGFQGDGCIRGYREMHDAYLSGSLNEQEMRVIDIHLIECRKCENTWDELSNQLEETFPTKIREIDENDEGLDSII